MTNFRILNLLTFHTGPANYIYDGSSCFAKLSKSMTNKTKSVGGQLEQTETPPDPTLSYYYWTLHSHTI